MSKAGLWSVFLVVGFGLGWWSNDQWQHRHPAAEVDLNDAVSVAVEEPEAGWPELAAQSTADLSSLPDWLQGDKVAAVIALLENNGLTLTERQRVLQQLDNALLQWQAAGRWDRLQYWLEPLHDWDTNYLLWQDLLVETYTRLERPRDALLVLFSSHGASLSQARRGQLMDAMDRLLARELARQQERTPTALSGNTALMSLLQLALEQQPQHAPFGLLLAQVYELSGEWDRALFQLQLLPYSEQYQAQVDDNKARLEQLLAEQQRAEEGIALQPMRGQFIVSVVFDDQVTLNLMIDTGATITALNPRAIALLQRYTGIHATDQQVQVTTANGVVQSTLYAIGRMRVGDWEQHDVQLLQVNLPSGDIDGLLGMNFLGQYAFSIDQNQALLFLDRK